MESYILFNKMKEAHETYNKKKGDLAEENIMFIRYSTLLARNEEENPFEENTDAYDTYYNFMYFFHKWPPAKATCAFKTAFLDKAEELCVYDNPFVNKDAVEIISIEEMKDVENTLTEIEDIASETYVPVNDNPVDIKTDVPKQMFGVVQNKRSHKNRRGR